MKPLSLDEVLRSHGAMVLHFGPEAYGAIESRTTPATVITDQASAEAYVERLRRHFAALEQEHAELVRLVHPLLDAVVENFATCTPVDEYLADDEGDLVLPQLQSLLAGERLYDGPDDEPPAGGAVPPADETLGGTA